LHWGRITQNQVYPKMHNDVRRVLACEHRIYEPMNLGVYIIDTLYGYKCIKNMSLISIPSYVIDTFHVIVCLCYRYICYKHLQMVVGTYLLLDSRLVKSRLCTHALASLVDEINIEHNRWLLFKVPTQLHWNQNTNFKNLPILFCVLMVLHVIFKYHDLLNFRCSFSIYG